VLQKTEVSCATICCALRQSVHVEKRGDCSAKVQPDFACRLYSIISFMVSVVYASLFSFKAVIIFHGSLKIELRAKTDSTDIDIGYAKGTILLDHMHFRKKLFVADITETGDEYKIHKNCGIIPVDEFIEIEWLIGKTVMAVKVNGELRYADSDCKYIKALKDNPELVITSPVTVYTMCGATVTVESLCVIEV